MANEIWCSQQDGLRHYFDLARGHLVPNHIAFFALKRKMNFYRSILSGEITFQQAVRSWLGHPDEDAAAGENANLEQRLLAFCENHLDQDLTDEEVAKLREMVITIADQIGIAKTRADRLESIGRDALNKRMATFKCPYRVARNAWRIINNQEDLT